MSTNEFEMKSIRLLLVEDNAADARVVERHLKDACLNQVTCDVVTTAGEAATRLQAVEYDLVLLDLGLPDATGLQASAVGLNLEGLRREPGVPRSFVKGDGGHQGIVDVIVNILDCGIMLG